jgi:hypothetical protein
MILSNPRHELFAQELAKGKRLMRPTRWLATKPDRHNASRLTTNDNIKGRVAGLQAKAANRAEVTVESLIAEAEEVRKAAFEKGQFAAAIAAIKEKGVLSGKRIERVQTRQPGEFENMSDAELLEFLRDGSAAIETRKDMY